MQVKESLLQRFLEMEQTAREQATDNAILDQLQKVYYPSEITSSN
jgi:trigger factor